MIGNMVIGSINAGGYNTAGYQAKDKEKIKIW